MEDLKTNSKNISFALIIAALLAGGSLVYATHLAMSTWKVVRGYENTLSVTGSTKEHVTSDNVKWTIEVNRHATEPKLKEANALIKEDLAAIHTWLIASGLDEAALTITPVNTIENYDYKQQAAQPREYILRSTITVSSPLVDKVTTLAKTTDVLADKGIFINTVSLEYYYSKLTDLRVKLLGAAIRDARARAVEIAKADNKSVGALKSASSGVVQVLPINSADVSDYGSYDTQNIEKEVSLTVHAAFLLN